MSTRFSSPNTPMHGRGAVPGAGALGADVPGTPGNAAPLHRELGAQLMAVHELGYLVLGEMAVEQVCSRVARLAHDTIAGVDEVSVTVLRGSCADRPSPSPTSTPPHTDPDDTSVATVPSSRASIQPTSAVCS